MVDVSKVIIYTTPSCVYCKMAKEFFKKNNVSYEEKDVVADLAAREDMLNKSGQMGVPVIEAGGKIIVGFDQSRLREALGMGA
ncbi:MAG: glutaredoxin domain-containing protein [Candidatus Sungiibacteriota bacterium]